ncbi:MAG: PDR/VanB family oxidoreductase [Burkholderiales bacterium]
MSAPTLNALVYALRHEAQGVIGVELRPVPGAPDFPAFDAGSHIDLHLPNGLVRSYSLVNPVTDRQRYVVGVLNDRASRGGSRHVHEQVRVGTVLPISAPRNNFKLHEDAAHTVLLAGGIGVTPIFCMLQRLAQLGKPVDFIYCARSRKEAAFIADIEAFADANIRLDWHFDDEQGVPPNLKQLLAGRPAHTHLYCCGPTPMLDAFERSCETLGYANAHIERFAAVQTAVPAAAAGYMVELKRTGKTIEVPPGKSLLDTLLDAGLSPDYSCKEGICGACETKVLAGEVEHHDDILTKAERAANKSMMICVSRCRRGSLVLDL